MLALMENYDKALSLTESAYNSAGSAMEKYDVYQKSIAAGQERITALFQEFVANMNIDDVITDILSLAEALLKIVSNDIISGLLKLAPAITAVGYAIMVFIKSSAKFTLDNIIAAFTMTTASTILSVVAAVSALYMIFSRLITTSDELRDSISGLSNEMAQNESDIQSYAEQLQVAEERLKELQAIKETGLMSAVEEDELATLQLQTKECELQIALLKEQNELKREQQKEDAERLWNQLSQEKQVGGVVYNDDNAAEQLLSYVEQIEYFEERIRNATEEDDLGWLTEQKNAYREKALELAQDLQMIADVLGESSDIGFEAGAALDVYYQAITSISDKIEEVFSDDQYSDVIERLTEIAAEGELTATTLNDEDFSEFIDALRDIGLETDDIIKKISELGEEATWAIGEIGAISDIHMVDTLEAGVTSVKNALEELNETGYLSHGTVKALEEAGYDLSGSLELTENGYKTNRQAILGLLEAQKAEYEATFQNSLKAAADLVGAKIDEKEAYDAVTNSILAKLEAQMAEAAASANYYMTAASNAFTAGDQAAANTYNIQWKNAQAQYDAMKKAGSNLKNSLANLDTYETAVEYLMNRTDESSGGSSGSSSEKDVETAFERDIRILEHRQFLAEQWAGVYKDNAETELQYQDKINEQIEIYGQLMARVHEEADKYRAQGYDDESEVIQDLQKQYWEYYNARKDLIDDLADYQKEKEEEERQAVEDALDKLKDAINDLIDEAEDRLDKLLDYYDYQIKKLEAMRDLTRSYYDSINEISELQHEIDVDLATSKSKYAYLDETLRKTLFNEDDYDKLSSKLQGIADDCDALYSNYLAQLSSLTEDEIYKADIITDEYERQYNYKLMEYQVANAELNLIRAQANLQEVLANRNVRMYQNGQWTWVADHDAVADAEEQLEEAKYDYRQSQIALRQQGVIDSYDQMIASLEMQKGAQEAEFEALREQWEEIEAQLTTEASAMDQILEVINTTNLPQLSSIIDQTGDSLINLINKISALAGGGSIPTKGSKGSSGGGGGSSGGGGGGGGSQKDFMESVGSDPDNYKDDDTSGYIPGYDPSVDYSQAYNDLKEQGASQAVLDKIEDYRDQKVEDVYGGKDPNPDWKKSYDSGGVLNGLGGIKATVKDEVVFDPSIASKLLSPTKSREFLNSAEALTKIMDNSSGLSRIMSALSGIVSNNQTSYTDSHNIILNGDMVSKISNEDFNSISSVLKRYIPVMRGG